MDEDRPSLPPLKAILARTTDSASTLTSQRRTSSSQPSPFEPTYNTSTYKPPALYPSYSRRPGSGRETTSEITNQLRTSNISGSVTRASDRGHVHYDSVRRDLSAPLSSHPSSHSQSASALRMHGEGSRSYQYSAEPRSVGMPYGHYPDPAHYHAMLTNNQERSTGRQGRADHGRHDAAQFSSWQHAHYTHARDIGVAPHRYGALPFAHPSAPYTFASNERMPIFMDGGRDGQEKRRKRNNLPKHSTEIMKTWFDKNLDNPYPSEEQKVQFSNATGISLTQVSNWFINHRRRCPELRDKRGKQHSLEADGGRSETNDDLDGDLSLPSDDDDGDDDDDDDNDDYESEG